MSDVKHREAVRCRPKIVVCSDRKVCLHCTESLHSHNCNTQNELADYANSAGDVVAVVAARSAAWIVDVCVRAFAERR